MKDTIEFLALGGPVIIILGLLSIVATTLFIERILATRRSHVLPARFTDLVKDHLRDGRHEQARLLADSNDSPVARLAVAALRRHGRPRQVIRDSVEEAGRREVADLEKNLGGIGSIASIAPLLGLLGTIIGMITTFRQVDTAVAEAGQVSPGAFASGIWEALITTAAGLVVAIPAYAVYRYLLGRVDRLTLALEETSSELAELVFLLRQHGTSSLAARSAEATSSAHTETDADDGDTADDDDDDDDEPAELR